MFFAVTSEPMIFWSGSLRVSLPGGNDGDEADVATGFLHPIIHLGFGLEFEQPAIVAEALAQAAVHDNWIGSLFDSTEKAVNDRFKKGIQKQDKPLAKLIEQIGADEVLSTAAHWDDPNKVRDGVLKRAPERMIEYASQYTVDEAELEEKVAEMINAAGMYLSVGLPPHRCSLTRLQCCSLAEHSTHPTLSNLTSTTCTASTRPSSSALF